VVAIPDSSDAFTLGKGMTRFDLPRATDVPVLDGAEAYAKVSGAAAASSVRVVLLRYTDRAGGTLTGDGSIVPDNVGRLVCGCTGSRGSASFDHR
jgi:hypothetical protein